MSRNGGIRWHKHWVNVSQTLGEECVGLVEIDDGEWDVYFGPLRLGRFHERTLLIEDALGRHYRRPYQPLSPMSSDLTVTHVLGCSRHYALVTGQTKVLLQRLAGLRYSSGRNSRTMKWRRPGASLSERTKCNL